MSEVFDDLERELRRAVRAKGARLPFWARRGRRRTSAIVLVAALLVSASALAAGGVIKLGSPTEGALINLDQGKIVKGTFHLLPISASDPASGLPWGMRVFNTKRGEGCIEVGRLDDGKLGAIGKDSAFGDDGAFHAFAPDTVGAARTCGSLDGAGQLFTNAVAGDVPASAWTGQYGNRGCVPKTADHAERYVNGKPLPACAEADERNLYFGLLGPDAKSVTYQLNGHSYTESTVRPDGAYLIVTRAASKQTLDFEGAGTENVDVPVNTPITELHYRDGATCHLTGHNGSNRKPACAPAMKLPVGWVPPKASVPMASQVASPIHVHLVHAELGGGYEAVVQFTSRIAISNTRSLYMVEWHEAAQRARIHSFGPPLPRYPAAGETVKKRLGRGLRRSLHPGLLTGKVIFDDEAGTGAGVKHIVGRFELTVP